MWHSPPSKMRACSLSCCISFPRMQQRWERPLFYPLWDLWSGQKIAFKALWLRVPLIFRIFAPAMSETPIQVMASCFLSSILQTWSTQLSHLRGPGLGWLYSKDSHKIQGDNTSCKNIAHLHILYKRFIRIPPPPPQPRENCKSQSWVKTVKSGSVYLATSTVWIER